MPDPTLDEFRAEATAFHDHPDSATTSDERGSR